MASTKTRKTVAPNHAQMVGNKCTAVFGSGREVPGWVTDTTVTDRGTVCVAVDPVYESDVGCCGVWTSQFRMA